MRQEVKLTGLWKKQDSNGRTFLVGRINTFSSLIVVPNSRKEADKDPDYICYIREDRRPPRHTSGPNPYHGDQERERDAGQRDEEDTRGDSGEDIQGSVSFD